MIKSTKQPSVLIAEDSPDFQILIREAWEERRLDALLHFVDNGEELLDYLYVRGKYVKTNFLCRPDLILLDLKMPKKDGLDVLREIKADSEWKKIPVIVLSCSVEEEDIYQSYYLGAYSYINKPVNYDSLCDLLKTLYDYWFKYVKPIPQR